MARADADIPLQSSWDVLSLQVQRVEGDHPGTGRSGVAPCWIFFVADGALRCRPFFWIFFFYIGRAFWLCVRPRTGAMLSPSYHAW